VAPHTFKLFKNLELEIFENLHVSDMGIYLGGWRRGIRDLGK
jgi:hypothetical protein